jgi:hypothetical protein
VLTPTVQGHLRNLARAVLLRRYPILLQASPAATPLPVQIALKLAGDPAVFSST